MNNEIKKDYMGMVSWHRVMCGSARPMFGSEIATANPIYLRISGGSMSRSHSDTRYHADIKPIIEVAMTPIQWAEFLTSGNTEGVPCTIKQRDGKQMPDVENPNIMAQFNAELKESADDVAKSTDEIIKYVQGFVDADKPMSKTKMNELIRLLKNHRLSSMNKMEYVRGEFEASMATVVMKAKSEINAYAESRLGLNPPAVASIEYKM